MRQSLRLPLPNASSILRASSRKPATAASSAATAATKPLVANAAANAPAAGARTFATTPAAMSLLRPTSLFSSPFFTDLDFPFGGGASRSGFPSLLGPSSDFFRNDAMWASASPKFDVVDVGSSYAVTAEVPGFKKEDLRINTDPERRRLTVEGTIRNEYSSAPTAEQQQEQQGEQQQNGGGGDKTSAVSKQSGSKEVATQSDSGAVGKVGHHLVSERVYGSFSRTFTLPSDADLKADLKARFQDGLLKLEVPKKAAEETKSRSIAIE